ncbi:MAG: flippase-like domain-containing protein [Bacilli bacterium]|nr:flippase-like domain-containing protein [Bacilli bacterium]
MKKNSKYSGIIILIITVLVLYFALKDDFIEKLRYLFSFDIRWLLFAILLMVMYWVLKSFVIYFCTRKFDSKYSFKKSIKLILDTQFFNAVTPFSTGGQPYQVYRLRKQGISLEQGTNIVIQDFIVYQIALISLGTIAVITNNALGFFPNDDLLKKLVIIGYLINLFVIIGLFVVAFNKKGNKFILSMFIKIGAKFKLIKDKDKFLDRSNEIITNFHNNAVILMNSRWHFVKIIFLNFMALVCLYLIPFALIMGLGEQINPFIAVVTSAYVMLIGSFVPIPGGSGGLEFGFVRFFGFFISGAKLSCIMIVWRLITYYLGLIVGAISTGLGEEE